MFRITEDPSSGSLVQCLAKNYRNVRVRICCHNTDLVHVNGHDRIILVIFSPSTVQGSLMMDPL